MVARVRRRVKAKGVRWKSAQVSEYEEEDDLPRPQVKRSKRSTKAVVREPNPDYLDDTMDEMDYNMSVSTRRGKGGMSYYLKFAKEYLDTIKNVRSPLTVEGLARRYRRQNSDLEHLYKSKRISTLSPMSMTVEDIRTFIQYRWDTGVSHSEMMHEIASMKSLFGFMGSNVFQEFLYRYPQMKAQKVRNMLPSLEEADVQRIVTFAEGVDIIDWKRLRAYAVVLFAICSGLRSKEMRLCNAEDISRTPDGYWLVKVKHPKGEGTYGKVRTVLMNPDCIPIMERYLEAREMFLRKSGNPTKALFVGTQGIDGYLRGNTLRKMKDLVSKETGIEFDLRKCRRTFGQRQDDRGEDIESVSKV